MSLYPSLEDMKIDQLTKAQVKHENAGYNPNYPYPGATLPPAYSPTSDHGALYPALGEFMGLELSAAVIAENMPEYNQIVPSHQVSLPNAGLNNMIAPLSSLTPGLQRAQVTHGIRELTLCKDKDNKVGLRVKPIDNGIFVCLVIDKSPAAIAGLRFGDQILQVNGVTVAGFTMDKVHALFRKSEVNGISVVVRDRPFERTLTLHKDSNGTVGFHFKNGKITSIVKDSSAARNGVLVEHNLLEVDGQNVVGLKDKEILEIIKNCTGPITITVIPTFLFNHMVKKMSGSLIRDLMDHSIPDL